MVKADTNGNALDLNTATKVATAITSRKDHRVNRCITDGKRYALETDPNTLYRLSASGSAAFEQIYRIVI